MQIFFIKVLESICWEETTLVDFFWALLGDIENRMLGVQTPGIICISLTQYKLTVKPYL